MAVRRHYCRSCRREVVAEADPVSHVLHFFVTLLTFGLWFPVWIIVTFFGRRWHCRHCGARTFGGKASTLVQRVVLAVLILFLLIFGLAALGTCVNRPAPGCVTRLTPVHLDG